MITTPHTTERIQLWVDAINDCEILSLVDVDTTPTQYEVVYPHCVFMIRRERILSNTHYVHEMLSDAGENLHVHDHARGTIDECMRYVAARARCVSLREGETVDYASSPKGRTAVSKVKNLTSPERVRETVKDIYKMAVRPVEIAWLDLRRHQPAIAVTCDYYPSRHIWRLQARYKNHTTLTTISVDGDIVTNKGDKTIVVRYPWLGLP